MKLARQLSYNDLIKIGINFLNVAKMRKVAFTSEVEYDPQNKQVSGSLTITIKFNI